MFWAGYNCTLLIESLVMATDRAGNTWKRAKNVALVSGRAVFKEQVGGADQNDFLRFTLSSRSSASFSLKGLKADANLQLLDGSRRIFGTSNRKGKQSELINKTLDAGTYYIRVYPGGRNGSSTRYTLSAITSPIPTPTSSSYPIDPGTGLQYQPDQMLIKFSSGVTSAQSQSFAQSLGALSIENLAPPLLQTGSLGQWSLLKFSPGTNLQQAQFNFAQNSLVETTQLDYILSINWIPSDPNFNQLWGLNNTGQTAGTVDADIDAPEAWDLQKGSSSVVVAVIDSGVDYNHPDLAANMWWNSSEIAGNSLDDDRNGFVDDIYGYDFINQDNNPMDDRGHGTHVAGTIGAVGNNNLGVVGVSPNVRLMALKSLGSNGSGPTSNAIRAIDYATRMGADIINASFGGGGYDQALSDAISQANSAGVLFVAAAGNKGINTDISPHYPSSYNLPNILSVAATTHTDQLASFSNYGISSVDLGAPGENIWSTLPGNQYGSFRGTSMAAPHVAGAAALLLAQSPNLTVSQLKDILMTTGEPLSALQGKTVSGKRLNLLNAIRAVTKPTITISATDSTAVETTSGQTPNPGQFTLTRTGNTASALTVNYSLAGTATNGTDYAFLNGGVTFGAGSSIATISVSPIDDFIVEASETVTVSLASSSTYMLGATTSANILIADNDTPTPVDNAGNTLATARAIAGGATQIFNDFVGDADTDDFYQLNIGSDRYFSLTLSGLSANANVQLIQDSNGNGIIDAKETLALSQLSGSASESFNLPILAGSYYVRVYQGGTGNNTNYNLSFTVTGLGTASYIDPSPVQSYFGTGVIRSFFNGTEPGYPSIYQSSNGKYVMHGAIAGYYTDNNFLNPNLGNGLYGVYSGLGLPTTPSYVQANGTQVMEFEGGSLFAQGNSVTVSYNQRNGDRFDLVGVGAPAGTELFWKNDYSYWSRQIGAPTSTVRRITNGWIQEFSVNNSVSNIFLLKDGQQPLGGFESYTNDLGQSAQVPAGGPYRVGGAFLGVYLSVGGYTRQTGGLGLPTMSIERRDYSGYKIYQAFENGFIAQTYSDQVVIRNWQGAPITP